MSGSGRPIARLNATDVNAIFDMSSTQSRPSGDGFKPVRGTDAGVFDIHEHDVLLQKASQPFGQRQLAVFSSLRNVQDLGEDDLNIQNIKNKYKFAGLAVTPFYVKLGADQFQPTQGFVSTFTGLNTVRVACDVLAGDILVAAPPLKCCRSKLHELVGKHTGPVMLVRVACARVCAN